ncbi:hypothetical protein FOL47_005786 [Perkinsus chesapeaki]|uniref:Uncharacterized protein n=1 Tax=Perkinsus chesapeaki TaxID=330153 RepID=A0A7J6MYG6_PERCH|nr:hypothetical protein FOL47_005786 [Perkinsus chesapeaki]
MTATVAYIKSIVTSSGNYRTLITINTAKDEVLGVIPFNMSISSIGGLRFHPEMIDFGLRRPDDYFLSHLELSARYDARPDMANTSAVEIYNVTYLSYKDNKVNNIEVIAEMKKSLVRISNKDDNVPVSNVWIDTSSSARGIIDVNGCLLVHTNISSTPIRIGVKGRVSNRLPKVYYADGEVRMQYWVEDGRVTSIDDITLTTEWGGNNIIEVVDRANVMDNALHDMVKVDIIMPTATNTGGSIKISLNHSHNILDNLGEDDRLRVFTKPTIIAVYTKDDRVMPLSLRLYTNTLIILLYNKDGRGDMVSSIYGDMKDKKFPLDSIEFGGNATVVLSISNPNPSSITIIDGLRVVEGDDGLMMNNRIEANIDYGTL